MPIEIIVPRLGWSMEEGTFSSWLKQEGDVVQAGQPLFVLESDKAAQEVESMDAGILRLPPDAPRPGSTVKVGQRLAYLLAPGERAPWETTSAPAGAPTPTPAVGKPSTAHDGPPPSASSPAALSPETPPEPPGPETPAGLPTISPRAARAARELGVDWTRVTGSGRTGRIRERDIRAAAAGADRLPAQTKPRGALFPVGSNSPGSPAALSATRRTIAERMTTSLRSTAPVTLATTEDVTRLVELREQWKTAASGVATAVVPSYTDVLVKLCAAALSRHPDLAARWDGDRLLRAQAMHIGIAVDTEEGLLVPVIHDVANLGLRDIAARSRQLIERARTRKLAAQELRGGFFTVTTLGSFGIDAFTPIINYPECAILGVGQVRREPWVVGDQIVVRHRVTFSLTFDHRAMDGATAARFLQTLCELVRAPVAHLELEA